MRDMCGRKPLSWVDSPGTICMFLPLLMGCGKKAKSYAFYLDDDKVAAAKAEKAREGGVEYVTTNDIITTGFFNEVNARIGVMGMDMRARMDGIGPDLAGNYVTALVTDPDTFATPAR